MFIGAYWSQREESKEAAAARIAAFLKRIGERFEHFAAWYGKARSRSAALRSSLVIDSATIARRLKVNRRDSDRQPIPELGFWFSAWNGKDASISVTIGAYSQYVGNSVVLSIGEDDQPDREACRVLLSEMVRGFDPDQAVVTSHEHLERSGAKEPWEAGWLTYVRGDRIREHPSMILNQLL